MVDDLSIYICSRDIPKAVNIAVVAGFATFSGYIGPIYEGKWCSELYTDIGNSQ